MGKVKEHRPSKTKLRYAYYSTTPVCLCDRSQFYYYIQNRGTREREADIFSSGIFACYTCTKINAGVERNSISASAMLATVMLVMLVTSDRKIINNGSESSR